MAIQLLISDLDGTLLGPDSVITPSTAAALERARQAGLRLLVTTGRVWGPPHRCCSRPVSTAILCCSTGRNTVPLRENW